MSHSEMPKYDLKEYYSWNKNEYTGILSCYYIIIIMNPIVLKYVVESEQE